MDKFLRQVASYLNQKYSKSLFELCLVFPNRRAGLFFQKYLSEIIKTPVFSPQIITIADLSQKWSGLELMDQNRLIIELYKVFSNVVKTNETIDDFFYWGEMLLADFNDIDKYQVDAKQLFSNIKSLRELDSGFDFLDEEQIAFISTFWNNLLQARDSESKRQFVSIWQNLHAVYEQFTQKLIAKGYAYEGLMYRSLISKLTKGELVIEDQQYVFVGFNALNQCEIKLFDFLQQKKTASFFWDYDDYYLNAKQHEAALFMKANLQRFPMPHDFQLESNQFINLKTIDVISVPGFSGQATFAADWMNVNAEKLNTNFDNTALVLCDETLLNPMLNVLPSMVDKFNITMGFPLKSSPVYALIKALVDIDRNARPDKNQQLLFYYRNVMGLLSNPLLKTQLAGFVEQLFEKIKLENKIYLTNADFAHHELLSSIFNLPETSKQCHQYLQQIITLVFKGISDDEKLIKESLYQLYLAVNRLADSLSLDNVSENEISKKLFYQLLLRQLERLTIPFEGEPLSGTQIMGFLETRCLDFDNLILLSFNDDKLPGSVNQHSFIPYSLRKGFGLPTIEQRNAMYAYYFYRLIQRAKNVSLVFDSRTDGMSKGEVSRFATQLKYEADHLKIVEKQAVFNFEPVEKGEIIIEKVPALIQKIEHHLTQYRISPSALNTYIACPLKFFFKYIEGISEIDDLAEDIDHLLFGRIAHLALELLYQPYIDREISPQTIDDILSNTKKLNESLQKALEKEFFKGGNINLNGRNMLVFEIIKKYVMRILKYDRSIAPFTLIGLEKVYEQVLEVNTTQQKVLSVRVGGTIDRIDRVGDQIRVVDYKTGQSESSVPSIEKLFIESSTRNKAAFQIMLYAGCVVDNLKTDLPVMPAVYGAREVFKDDFDPLFSFKGGKLIYQANAEEFNQLLKQLIAEIADVNIPITQTNDQQKCKYCSFNGICCRY